MHKRVEDWTADWADLADENGYSFFIAQIIANLLNQSNPPRVSSNKDSICGQTNLFPNLKPIRHFFSIKHASPCCFRGKFAPEQLFA